MTKLTNLVYHVKFLAILAVSALLLNICVGYIAYHELFQDPAQMTVAFLNIGQGDSIFVRTPDHQAMLIDGGLVTSNVLAEIGTQLPFYDREIDVMMESHPDADHIGGLPLVLKNYQTSVFIEPGLLSNTIFDTELHEIVRDQHIQSLKARRGMRIVFDKKRNIYFEVLFPDRDVSQWVKTTNDASIVGRLVYNNISFMLNGDSPIKIEEHLLRTVAKDKLQSTVLKAGHHGSRTSTSDIYVKTLKPTFAVISAGKENKYKHPHNEVLTILKNNHVQMLRTDTQGRIVFRTNGTDILFDTEK